MATEFNRAVARFIATCAYVTAVHDLVTNGQIEPSTLTGDPDHDLAQVRLEIEAFLAP